MTQCQNAKVYALALLIMLAGIAGSTASSAYAQAKSVKPGINQSYERPDVSAMVRRFESAGREIVDHQQEIIAACDLKAGNDVADIGAGTGLFTRPFAELVRPGTVYAIDISEEFLEHIARTCRKQGIKNVKTLRASERATPLEANSIDLAFVCDTYHHFEYPQETLASIHRALRPDGRLVIVEFKKGEGADSRMDNHVRADRKTVIAELAAAGFRVTDQPELMKGQYVLVAVKQ